VISSGNQRHKEPADNMQRLHKQTKQLAASTKARFTVGLDDVPRLQHTELGPAKLVEGVRLLEDTIYFIERQRLYQGLERQKYMASKATPALVLLMRACWARQLEDFTHMSTRLSSDG
jgi:hypothetical protein